LGLLCDKKTLAAAGCYQKVFNDVFSNKEYLK
jgi:hypothetical protein